MQNVLIYVVVMKNFTQKEIENKIEKLLAAKYKSFADILSNIIKSGLEDHIDDEAMRYIVHKLFKNQSDFSRDISDKFAENIKYFIAKSYIKPSIEIGTKYCDIDQKSNPVTLFEWAVDNNKYEIVAECLKTDDNYINDFIILIQETKKIISDAKLIEDMQKIELQLGQLKKSNENLGQDILGLKRVDSINSNEDDSKKIKEIQEKTKSIYINMGSIGDLLNSKKRLSEQSENTDDIEELIFAFNTNYSDKKLQCRVSKQGIIDDLIKQFTGKLLINKTSSQETQFSDIVINDEEMKEVCEQYININYDKEIKTEDKKDIPKSQIYKLKRGDIEQIELKLSNKKSGCIIS
jgi:hypothetical protein